MSFPVTDPVLGSLDMGFFVGILDINFTMNLVSKCYVAHPVTCLAMVKLAA